MLMVYKYKDVLKDLAIGFTVTFSFEDLLLVSVPSQSASTNYKDYYTNLQMD